MTLIILGLLVLFVALALLPFKRMNNLNDMQQYCALYPT
jgi:hypothetical protein